MAVSIYRYTVYTLQLCIIEHPNSVDLKGPCRAIAYVISCHPMTAEAQIKSQGTHSIISNLTCDLYN